jgi:hypothetical protein
MIINLPKSTDYENVAKQCLTQAFNIVYEIDKELIYDGDIDSEAVWDYHLGDLSTSLILVYQAIESLMKARICQESALLLLDLKRTDWPTMPGSLDKDFNELFTVGGEALQKTYCAVAQTTKKDEELIKFIEEIRLTRNKIIHGVSRDYLDPEYLIEIILNTFTNFLGKDSWWLTMREFQINSPIFGEFNNNYEEAFLIEKLDYTETLIDFPELRKHFSLDLKSRRYFCPWCMDSLADEDTDLETKWALLIPQKIKGATEIKCINCQRSHIVIREKCQEDDCKGDVFYEIEQDVEKKCLTCNSHQ